MTSAQRWNNILKKKIKSMFMYILSAYQLNFLLCDIF